MIVRIEMDGDKHCNFYEGSHIGFHKEEERLVVVVEERKNSITVEVDEGSNTQIFLMNQEGKTIEKLFV